MAALLKPSLDWLLVCVPAAALMELLSPGSQTWIFFLAALAVVPLAGWMGRATEHLAQRTSETLGGLLNATFGNAAEFIIALAALRRGMTGIVKASLTGSIIGNLLLVLGGACLAGGLCQKDLKFSARAARMQATMLILAAVSLIAPAAFHALGGRGALHHESSVSAGISVVLLSIYVLGLYFSLHTHKHFADGPVHHEEARSGAPNWSLRTSLVVLLAATVLVAWMSEILVGSVEEAAHTLGMSDIFVGIIVVAIIGNAAEHSTAILMARHNRMDLSLGIAVGSSIQIALFVAPLMVLLSFILAPTPMNLVFSPAEVLAVVLAVALAGQVTSDGESNWMEGTLLLALYLILGILFFFLPAI